MLAFNFIFQLEFFPFLRHLADVPGILNKVLIKLIELKLNLN